MSSTASTVDGPAETLLMMHATSTLKTGLHTPCSCVGMSTMNRLILMQRLPSPVSLPDGDDGPQNCKDAEDDGRHEVSRNGLRGSRVDEAGIAGMTEGWRHWVFDR
jgi:hypothetical protein